MSFMIPSKSARRKAVFSGLVKGGALVLFKPVREGLDLPLILSSAFSSKGLIAPW